MVLTSRVFSATKDLGADVYPTLEVYTPITDQNTFVEDISPYATNYRHTTRLLGGYWTATWTLAAEDMKPGLYQQWRDNRYFYDFKEKTNGTITWEGSIEGIEPDDDRGLLNITAYGYVHSIANQYNSTTNAAATANASDWIETLRATDTEFIVGSIATANTLQCFQAGTDNVWREMMKVVELGDGVNKNPWSIGVYAGRWLYYQMVSADPLGYVRGGMRWRVDMPGELYNSVVVTYTDETGTPQTDITLGDTLSQGYFGVRQARLSRTYITTASATALCGQYLNDHMWPYPLALGSGRDIQVYNTIGNNLARNPWVIQPGVYQDTSIISPTNFPTGWLPDSSYFLADEVVASSDGIQLKTSKWTESDAIKAYYDYLRRAPKPEKQKKKKRIL